MLEHATFSNDIANALGSYNCPHSLAGPLALGCSGVRNHDSFCEAIVGTCQEPGRRTFIFANVFECKGQTSVFALDDADLSEGAATNHAQEAKVVQVH